MAGRRSGHDEWDVHRDEIHRLYIEENRKLSEVTALMTQQRGFKRTYAYMAPRARVRPLFIS